MKGKDNYMARPAPSIQCPACGQPFSAILEQILDVQSDPTAKERLLSGRVNLVTCPHCGYRGAIGTPLIYHDASQQLAVVFVPMELNLQQEKREKIIGEMTRALMNALPEDAPKGYLLQPSTALTFQGLIDQVLEADGITPEMQARERKKIEVIQQLAEAKKDERQQLLEEHTNLVDMGFLELLSSVAQAASQAGENRQSLRLLNTLEYLMGTTDAGREMKVQQDALVEASQELQALGEEITREKFVNLLLAAVDNPPKLNALGTLGRTILDYSTFQILSERIKQTQDPDLRTKYEEARDRMVEINAAYEQQTRALMERAAGTLRMLIQAPDIHQAIQANIDRIDETFLQVLQVNLEEAQKSGQIQIVERLNQIRDTILQMIQAQAPPEVQLINALMSTESEEESIQMLHEQKDLLTDEVVHVMGDLAQQLRESGNKLAAERLEVLQAEAQTLI